MGVEITFSSTGSACVLCLSSVMTTPILSHTYPTETVLDSPKFIHICRALLRSTMAVSVSYSITHFPMLQRNRPDASQFQQIPMSRTSRAPLLKFSLFRCISQLDDKTQSTTIKIGKNCKTQHDSSLNSPIACRFNTANYGGVMTKEEENPKLEAHARGRNIRMSADKARRVINQIRGRKYEDVLLMLQFMPYRACVPILKLVMSAAANAKNNLGLKKTGLIVSKAEVDGARMMKRMRPRARGRANTIRKRSCHITVAVRGSPKDLETEKKST